MFGKTCPHKRQLELLANVVRVQRGSASRGENKLSVGIRLTKHLLLDGLLIVLSSKRVDGVWRQLKGAPRARGFRIGECRHPVRGTLERSPDAKSPLDEVNIAPLQREQFTLSAPSEEGDCEQRRKAIASFLS